MNETLQQIAVVGCGYWGPNLVRNFASVGEGCRVKYVCDTSEERLAHMKRLFPSVIATTDFRDLESDAELDAIAVATPVRFHHELARRSLLAGKHTLIEKPMAMSSEQCSDLVHLAALRKLTLLVDHTFIYSTPVRRIKEIIESGEIGEIQYISSRRLNLGLFQQDINVTWDLAPHDISIILYLMGKLPVAVNCQGMAHIDPNVEDVTNLSLQFESGGFGMVHSSWLDPNKVREMIIVGSRQMIVYNDNVPLEKIKVYDKRVEAPPHYDTFAEFHYAYHYGDASIPYLRQVEPLKVEVQHFLDCIRTGQTPETSGLAGLQVVQILEAASRSLKADGAKIAIDVGLGKRAIAA